MQNSEEEKLDKELEAAKRRIRRNAELTPRVRLETKEEIINWFNAYDE